VCYSLSIVRRERLTVIEPVHLMSVQRRGRRLRIVVRDRTRRLHVMHLRASTVMGALSHALLLTGWAADRVSVAYVRGRTSGALVNVPALLDRAL